MYALNQSTLVPANAGPGSPDDYGCLQEMLYTAFLHLGDVLAFKREGVAEEVVVVVLVHMCGVMMDVCRMVECKEAVPPDKVVELHVLTAFFRGLLKPC